MTLSLKQCGGGDCRNFLTTPREIETGFCPRCRVVSGIVAARFEKAKMTLTVRAAALNSLWLKAQNPTDSHAVAEIIVQTSNRGEIWIKADPIWERELELLAIQIERMIDSQDLRFIRRYKDLIQELQVSS